MKFVLQFLTLIFISNLLIAEENLVLDKIDVYKNVKHELKKILN